MRWTIWNVQVWGKRVPFRALACWQWATAEGRVGFDKKSPSNPAVTRYHRVSRRSSGNTDHWCLVLLCLCEKNQRGRLTFIDEELFFFVIMWHSLKPSFFDFPALALLSFCFKQASFTTLSHHVKPFVFLHLNQQLLEARLFLNETLHQ